MPHRTLNLEQAADRLHLSVAELERFVKDDAIPFQRLGGRIVFRQTEIEVWASAHILSAGDERLAKYDRRASPPAAQGGLLLPELVTPTSITAALPARTRASVIREMVALADRTGWVCDPAELIGSLEAREDLCPTAVPGGVAFLHSRTPDPYRFDRSFLVLGRTVQPVHFGAPDHQPTDVFFLLCNQDDRQHLHLLARLCLLAQRTRLTGTLRSAPDAKAMGEMLLAAEVEALRSGRQDRDR